MTAPVRIRKAWRFTIDGYDDRATVHAATASKAIDTQTEGMPEGQERLL